MAEKGGGEPIVDEEKEDEGGTSLGAADGARGEYRGPNRGEIGGDGNLAEAVDVERPPGRGDAIGKTGSRTGTSVGGSVGLNILGRTR